MDSIKAEKISRLVTQKDELNQLISWHLKKCFVFAEVKIELGNPMHSRLLAVFQERLKYVESELEKE